MELEKHKVKIVLYGHIDNHGEAYEFFNHAEMVMLNGFGYIIPDSFQEIWLGRNSFRVFKIIIQWGVKEATVNEALFLKYCNAYQITFNGRPLYFTSKLP